MGESSGQAVPLLALLLPEKHVQCTCAATHWLFYTILPPSCLLCPICKPKQGWRHVALLGPMQLWLLSDVVCTSWLSGRAHGQIEMLEEWCCAGAALSVPLPLRAAGPSWLFYDCPVHPLLPDLMVAMYSIFYTNSLARFKPVLSSPLGQGRWWLQGSGQHEQWSNENYPAQCLWQQRSGPSSGACE